MTYLQIGLLLTVPDLLGSILEMPLALLGDAGRRRRIVLSGGLAFILAWLLTAGAWSFESLLLAALLASPASGAFVSLAQASLMDVDPDAHERSMARWVVAGSVGVVAGPLVLAGSAALGPGWRGAMLLLALGSVPVVLAARRLPLDQTTTTPPFSVVMRGAFRALRRREVLRWLVLLELTDLIGDVLYGFLALYLVDVVGLGPVRASLGVAVWSVAGLAGDALLVPLLDRMDGVRFLRATAAAVGVALPVFLLAPGAAWKLPLLALLGILGAGWYAIPKARLFSALPGASGTAIALADLSGLLGRLFPLAIGVAAQSFGLGTAMWLMMAAPLALLVGLPRASGRPS